MTTHESVSAVITVEPFIGVLHVIAKVTVVLIVAWISHLYLRGSNPRWRILVWRVTAVGLIGVTVFSVRSPLFTLPLLPASITALASTDTQLTASAAVPRLPRGLPKADGEEAKVLPIAPSIV